MIDKMIRALEKTQMETLVSQLIEAAPVGVVILDDAFNYVHSNAQIGYLLHKSEDETTEKFGNLFQCSAVSETESVCGTRHQCENCKIRNTILNAGLLQRVVGNVKIKHTFLEQGMEIVRWFDLSVFPFDSDRRRYFLLMLNDQTDSMQHRIDHELTEMLGKKTGNDPKRRFKEQVADLIRATNISASDDAFLVSITVKDNWPTTEGQMRAMFQNFSNFVIQQLDRQIVYVHLSSEQLLLYFNDHDEAKLGTFNTRLRQFCDLNYEHDCRFDHRVLKIDVKPLRMNPNVSKEALMREVEKWITSANAMTGEGIERYSSQ
jgi:hypothetical protein